MPDLACNRIRKTKRRTWRGAAELGGRTRSGERADGILRSMDRSVLLEHVRRTRFASDGRAAAREDAHRIARLLKRHGARRIVGIGSAFATDRRFTPRSDIDLAVEGLPPHQFFRVSAQAAALTDYPLDLVPIETASAAFQRIVREEGVEL